MGHPVAQEAEDHEVVLLAGYLRRAVQVFQAVMDEPLLCPLQRRGICNVNPLAAAVLRQGADLCGCGVVARQLVALQGNRSRPVLRTREVRSKFTANRPAVLALRCATPLTPRRVSSRSSSKISFHETEGCLSDGLAQVPLLASSGATTGKAVHPDHLVPGFQQPLNKVGSYKPRRSCHQYSAQ